MGNSSRKPPSGFEKLLFKIMAIGFIGGLIVAYLGGHFG